VVVLATRSLQLPLRKPRLPSGWNKYPMLWEETAHRRQCYSADLNSGASRPSLTTTRSSSVIVHSRMGRSKWPAV